MSSNRILFGGMAALLIGGVIFLIVQMSSVTASGVKVGARPAAASCTKENTIDCLPKVTFIDSTQEFWTPELVAGKVVVVNFWATWCVPCREEMPQFVKAQQDLGGQGVQFIGIAIDQPDKIDAFAKELNLNYPALVGGYGAIELSKAMGNRLGALPFTVIVDRTGRVAHTQLGPLKDRDLRSILSQLL